LSYVQLDKTEYFDVSKIFDCGQCFRFDEVKNSRHECEFSGVAYGKHVAFAQDGDTLYVYNSTLDEFDRVWRRYLGLDMDYRAIEREIIETAGGEHIARAAEQGRGIRILRQEPFETLISFIISQNNNIPRIKKLIESLSARCGERIEISEAEEMHLSGVSSLCAFPDAKSIYGLGVDGLAELKTGFRAKYIHDAVSKVLSGEIDLDSLMGLSSERQVEALCEIKGVGPKVASCVSLFGLCGYDAFPIDVWIKRVGEKRFAGEDFSAERFGQYAGIAQQFLFYYERYIGE
jgi:N-glycosylase/DNA lyase